MISFTLTEWVVVALVLLFGWLLGLLSSSGGKKWRQRYESEKQAHAATKTAEAERVKQLEIRNAELEKARAAAPATGTAAATGAATAADRQQDDLSQIRGVGAPGAERLRLEGVHSYRDVEAIDDRRAATLEEKLRLKPGTIDREDWRGQARALREGR